MRDGLRRLIVSGSLPLGEKLPSVRELAAQLVINPNTIQRAYRELEAEGYIISIPGKGSYANIRSQVDEGRKKELLEAIAAGSDALNTVNVILDELGDAEVWATWDMFGGGMISDLAKHSHLDSAQHNVSLLQSQLRRFRTELADVGSAADGMQVSIDGFMRFANYFFDGFFAD